MSNDRQLNYVNDLQNRDQRLYYVDDASELNSINLKENDKIYAINDNKLFQMENTDQEEELSGSIVSFNGRNNTKIKSLVANIEPQQDLHGYDHPWPAGGNENLWIPPEAQTFYGVDVSLSDDGGIILSGTPSISVNIEVPIILKAGTYYLGDFSTGSFPVNDSAKFDITQTNLIVTNRGGGSRTDTLAEDISVKLRVRLNGGFNYSVVVKPMLISGSSAPTVYSPYSNICPISGWTGAEISRIGVNAWDEEIIVGGYYDNTGVWKTNQVISAKNYIPVKPGTNVYVYLSTTAPAGSAIALTFWDANKTFLSRVSNKQRSMVQIPDNCYYLMFNCNTPYGITYNHDISINYPATDTEYHPYTGNQISVMFPTTIYGGSNELVSGTLISDMGYIPDLGALTWTKYDVAQGTLFRAAVPNIKKTVNSAEKIKLFCSAYPYVIQNARSDKTCSVPTKTASVDIIDNRYSDVESFKAAMSGVQLCYEFAEPIEYILTQQPMVTLYGINNIWADTGDITVKIVEKGITAFELKPYT